MDVEVRLPDKIEDAWLHLNLFVFLRAESGNPSLESKYFRKCCQDTRIFYTKFFTER